jgi:hypothetical protein
MQDGIQNSSVGKTPRSCSTWANPADEIPSDWSPWLWQRCLSSRLNDPLWDSDEIKKWLRVSNKTKYLEIQEPGLPAPVRVLEPRMGIEMGDKTGNNARGHADLTQLVMAIGAIGQRAGGGGGRTGQGREQAQSELIRLIDRHAELADRHSELVMEQMEVAMEQSQLARQFHIYLRSLYLEGN